MSNHIGEEILRQIIMRMINGLSARKIAKDLNINRKTINKYYRLLPSDKDQLRRYLDLDKEAFERQLFKPLEKVASEVTGKQQYILSQIEYYKKELERTGVNYKVLWEEYILDFQDERPCGYASYCRIIGPRLRALKTSYHKHYQPGELLMVDFAGDTVSYVDRSTGEVIECVVFIGVLPFSNYTYVEVLPNAKLPYLIRALSNNTIFIQGVPAIVLTDNMKQMITKPNRYEPDITSAIMAWANHNRTVIQACNVASPREKSPVEGHVKIIYQRIYAPLRNQIFYSYQELCDAFKQRLKEHNEKKFQGRTYSRWDQFISEEMSTLRPLPEQPFKMQHFATVKVQKNYHVMLGEDRHFYSVPFIYVGKTVQLIYTTETVEVYYQMVRIATHIRECKQYGYTTTRIHMPKNDQHYDEVYGYSSSHFIELAEKVGECTKKYIERMIQSREVEQQAYAGCLGVLRLGEKSGNTRLENACHIGLQMERYNYKTIDTILKNDADRKIDDADDTNDEDHGNLRGSEAF